MKTKLTILLLAAVSLGAFAFNGCTPSQLVANGNYVAGAQFATFVLANHPDMSPALQNLSAKLPDIVAGRVSAYEMGQLNKQLEPLFAAAGQAKPQNEHIYVQIGSLLQSGAKLNGSNPTAYQGLAMAAAADFQNGINDSIQFNAGRSSITDPPAVKAAASVRAATVGR